MTSKRYVERRIERLEDELEKRATESPEMPEHVEEHIEGIINSLDEDRRAAIEEVSAEIRNQDEVETDEFGMTEAKARLYDIITSGDY